MAKAGLLTDKLYVGEKPNPYAPSDTSGLDDFGSMSLDQSFMPTPKMPTLQRSRYVYDPDVGINRGTGELYVQGQKFAADDAARALEVEPLLSQPGTGELPSGFEPIGADAFQQYLGAVKDPSMWRLAAKNFGRRVDMSQMLAGRALQFAGAEELGQGIVASQLEDLRKTSPYERMFTDIGSEPNRRFFDWLVANFAQQGPNMIESAVTAALGFAVGGLAGGGANPLTAAGGALLNLTTQQSFKQGVLAAAKKYTEGKALTAAETKLLQEAAGITAAAQIRAGTFYGGSQGLMTAEQFGAQLAREAVGQGAARAAARGLTQARVGGAGLASIGQNYLTGVADIYGETIESGDPDRATAADLGILYALFETLPEFVLAGRVFGNLGGRAKGIGTTPLSKIESRLGKAGELAKRAGVGFGVGGTLEGTTEASQEGLLLAANQEVDWDSPEGIDRLINSFAAGFGIGGPIGAGGGLFGTNAYQKNEPINVLNPGQTPEPGAATTPITPPPDSPLLPSLPFIPAAPMEGQLMPRAQPPQLGGPGAGAAAQIPMAQGVDLNRPYTILTGEEELPTGPGTQGVLPLFETMPANEMAARMSGVPAMPAALPLETGAQPVSNTFVNPQQGALQFAPGAPEIAAGTMAGQLRGIERLRQVGQAQAQRQAQIDAQREADFTQMEAQRQLQLAQQPVETLPMVQPTPAQPQQMRLPLGEPTRRQARAEALRRGIPRVRAEAPAAQQLRRPTPGEFQRAGQLPLFTQEGQPSVAALRGAGTRQPVAPPVEEVGAVVTVPPATAAKVRENVRKLSKRVEEAQKAAAKVEETVVKAAPAAKPAAEKLKKGAKRAVQERGAAQVPARKPAEAGPRVGEKVPVKREAPRKAEALRKGEAKKEEAKPPVQPKVEEKPPRPKAEAAVTPAAVSAKPVEPEAPAPVVEKRELKTDKDFVEDAIERVETTRNKTEYVSSLAWLLDFAENADSNQKKAGLDKRIYDFVNELPIDETFREAVRKFASVQTNGVLASKQGKLTDMFELVLKSNMLEPLRRMNKLRDLPPEFQKNEMAKSKTPAKPVADKDDVRDNPGTRLANRIYEINTSSTAVPRNQRKETREELADMWDEVVDADQQNFLDHAGNKLSDYFTEGGQPKVVVYGSRMRVTTTEETPGKRVRGENIVPEETEDKSKQSDLNQILGGWNRFGEGGLYFRDDGAPIKNPVPLLRIRSMVSKFLNTVVVKPRIFVYKNQADLKARNPELYAQAVAARPQGDFDTTSAVAYSFGNNRVIVFSDRVATEQQLSFVLAHESVGHIGLRALIPENKFNPLMEDVYDKSPAIQAGVDAAMAERGMPKAEAVEEYLADFAAELDVSIVARIWNAIKGMLNKLGVKFGDEYARYLVSNARKYVRTGRPSAFFDAAVIVNRLRAIEGGMDPDGTGRFAQTGNLRADSLIASLGTDNKLPMSYDQLSKWLRDNTTDADTRIDKFLNKFFRLLVFKARENPGLSAIHDVVSQGRDISMQIKVSMNEALRDVLNRQIDVPGLGDIPMLGGISTEQLNTVNDRLYSGMKYALSKKLTDADLGKTPLFFIDEQGEVKKNKPEIDRLFNLGNLKFEQMRDGFSYEIEYMDENDQLVKATETVPGIEGLTEDSIEWKGYLAAREVMRDVEVRLLQARYLSYTQDRDLAFREIAEMTIDDELQTADKAFLDRMYGKYKDLWTSDIQVDDLGNAQLNPASIENADKFIAALNKAIIATEEGTTDAVAAERNNAVAEFFTKAQYDDVINSIENFKKRVQITEENKFLIQSRMKDIITSEITSGDENKATKQTLATGYIPLLRRGAFQVRMAAYDAAGRLVTLADTYKNQLIYSQFEKESEALDFTKQINDVFGTKTYQVKARDENGNFVMMPVRFRAESETAVDAVAAPPQLNLNEFVRGLRQFKIALNPQKLEQVIVALTKQNDRARQRLKRDLVKGYDPNAIRAVTEHVESRASTIAKVIMRPKINELMNLSMRSTQALWNGSQEKLNNLRNKMNATMADPNSSDAARLYARREYETYSYMYKNTNPQGRARRGMAYYNEAASLLSFLDNNKALDESDFGSGEVVSRVRAATSLLQLGGSIATGALNYIGAITNGIPFLAYYNDKNGFGGGFGFGKSFAAFMTGLNQVGLRRAIGNWDMNTALFYDRVAESAELQAQYGLKPNEARFIAKEIREGVMIPAQSNALLSTARGRTASGLKQKAIDGFMVTFNATEQATRRALGLAAYRLEYERSLLAGKTEAEADAAARDFAVDALRMALGEYSVINRPNAWRSGVQSFLYMYKTFPTTSIQLLANLSKRGQIHMLVSLWLLSGVMGFPFAEDLEDIIDTIAQKLGFKSGSIRYEIAKVLDGVVPGSSAFLMNGMANYMLPADLAARTELGNFIPGTGVLLAGSNVGRELIEIGGPAASMLLGVAGTSADLLRTPISETISLETVAREAPVTVARMLGDFYAYTQSDAIVDRRGYVVSENASTAVLLTRLLGFYPQAAAQEYANIRIGKRITDYHKEVSAGFQQSWVKSMLRGDEDQADDIEQAVSEWNKETRNTALEIRNFQRNARRALREARRPAGERFLRTTPKAAREDIETLTEIMGY